MNVDEVPVFKQYLHREMFYYGELVDNNDNEDDNENENENEEQCFDDDAEMDQEEAETLTVSTINSNSNDFFEGVNSSQRVVATHVLNKNDHRGGIARYIIISHLPCTEVENVNFRKFIRALNPSSILPSADTIANDITTIHFPYYRTRIKDILADEKAHGTVFVLGSDMWRCGEEKLK